MLMLESDRTFRATRFSDAVPRSIRQAWVSDRPLRVHSVYRSTINIAAGDGLLTLAQPDGGCLPNGVLVDLGPDCRAIGLSPGMVVMASSAAIHLPAIGLRILLGEGRNWSPRITPSRGGASESRLRWRDRAPAVRAAAARLARARWEDGGLGPLLMARSRRRVNVAAGGPGTVSMVQPVIVARATGALSRFRTAVDECDRSSAELAARDLVGLGPGLTPSGDDVLVGMEAALHALDHPMAGFLADAVGDAPARTTAVSATLLRHAAVGEFSERLHELLAALLGPDPAADGPAIEVAAAWGATSGLDCIVGVLTGLDAATSEASWSQ